MITSRLFVTVVAAALLPLVAGVDAGAQAVTSSASAQNGAVPATGAVPQAPPPIDPALLALPRRPETQAVIDTCREKGHRADTRHTLMVFRAALEILKVKDAYPEVAGADPLMSEVAVMLHDIGGGGLAGTQPGAAITRDVLGALKEKQHFSEDFVAKVARIVETHHVTGTVKGKDDNPEWFLVLLADTPKIYMAATGDSAAFATLVKERIEDLKTRIQ